MRKIDILKSIEYSITQNKHVSINEQGVDNLVSQLSNRRLLLPYYDGVISDSLISLEDIVQYFFVADNINFKFWHDNLSRYTLDGRLEADAMYYALNNNLWLLSAEELANLDIEKARNVFQNIPMLEERTDILHCNGEILLDEYNGKAINLLEAGNFEIPKILDILATIPSWSDMYKKHIFMKRAQLFLAMVAGRFQHIDLLKGIEELTIFADYEIPKILEHLDVLRYSPELKNKISNREMIESGSEEELALRSFTIYAGEILASKLNCPSVYLDYQLWQLGVESEKQYHYTKSIWY